MDLKFCGDGKNVLRVGTFLRITELSRDINFVDLKFCGDGKNVLRVGTFLRITEHNLQ